MNEQTMTLQELAIVAGVSTQTVRRVANKLFPAVSENGKLARYNHLQSMEIIKETRKKNIVEPLQNGKVALQNGKVDIQAIINATAEATATAVLRALNHAPRQEPKQITGTPDNYYSVMAYNQIHGLSTNIEYVKRISRAAKKICNEQGFEVRHIADERYGKINLYPQDVLQIAWKYI